MRAPAREPARSGRLVSAGRSHLGQRNNIYYRLEELEVSGNLSSIDLCALGLLGGLGGGMRLVGALMGLTHVIGCILREGWSDVVHGKSLTVPIAALHRKKGPAKRA